MMIFVASCGDESGSDGKYTVQKLKAGETATFEWGTMKIDNPVPNPGLYPAYQKVPVEIKANDDIWIGADNFKDVKIKTGEEEFTQKNLMATGGLFEDDGREFEAGDSFKGYVYFDNNTANVISVRFGEDEMEYGADWEFTYDTDTVTEVDVDSFSNQLINTMVTYTGYCSEPLYDGDGGEEYVDVMVLGELDDNGLGSHIRTTVHCKDVDLIKNLRKDKNGRDNGSLVKVTGRVVSFMVHKKECDYYDWFRVEDATIEVVNP